MNFAENDISLIAVLAMASLMPFRIAVGTCYIKFSVVFTLVRNGLGLQQVPSNMVINALALMLAAYVMQPILTGVYDSYRALSGPLGSIDGVVDYKSYLARYPDADLLGFFERARMHENDLPAIAPAEERSLFSLIPAYALSELKDAFRLGFFLFLPFIVVDLVVSSVLLSLGMMMMSP